MTDGVKLTGVSVDLDGKKILAGVDLVAPSGSTVAIVGPSGAGKSTLLRAVAGLAPIAAGEIALDGRVVAAPGAEVDPARRGVGFLFQGFALWPHMTVAEHLTFVLDAAKTPRNDTAARIDETLAALGLSAKAGRVPATLSGGERQRLALARAVVGRPRALLLDEPTASLDPATARDARALIASLSRRFGTTVLVVTHDQDEALELGDEVVVLAGGAVRQSGTPEALYRTPRDAFVARFLGEGSLVPATVDASGAHAATPFGSVAVLGATPAARGRALLRPEHLEPSDDGVATDVVAAAFRGAVWRHRVTCDGATALVDAPVRTPPGGSLRVRTRGVAAFLPPEGA